MLARDEWHVIQVALGVGVMKVGSRRDHPAVDRQRTRGDLDRSDRPERVSDHRFDRADRDSVGVIAEGQLERGRLMAVILLGARAVGVDVRDVRRLKLGLEECHADRLGHFTAVRLRPVM